VFPIADDHRYNGLGSVIADYYGGPRAITRITVDGTVPTAPLTVRQDPSWSCDWKLFQRDDSGTADIPVKVFYGADGPGTLQARVVRASDGSPLAGFDWADHSMAVAASPGTAAEMVLAAVPREETTTWS